MVVEGGSVTIKLHGLPITQPVCPPVLVNVIVVNGVADATVIPTLPKKGPGGGAKLPVRTFPATVSLQGSSSCTALVLFVVMVAISFQFTEEYETLALNIG